MFYHVLNVHFQFIKIHSSTEAEISLSYNPVSLYNDTQISLKNGIFRNNIHPSCSGVIYFIRVVVVACASIS